LCPDGKTEFMPVFLKCKKMKRLLILVLAASFLMVSCNDKTDDPVPVTTGTVYFVFKNEIDGQPIQTGSISYTNEAGNVYSVDELEYYISNMTFIKSDGSEFKAPENYELIDESKNESKVFAVSGVPFGAYSHLRFNVGVDSTHNFSGAQNGDLDPVLGMLWDWSSGYVFFKHIGYFMDSTGVQTDLQYHYGTLKGLVTEELPVTLDVSSTQRIVTITFNLNKIYRSPNMINFNGENIHQSTGPGENGWLQLIKANFAGAFEITEVL
jgi:hypothetical protein